MILIAHRGNTMVPQPHLENHPDYIQKAIEDGFDVEIDMWVIGKDILLGHDRGEHPITSLWLYNRRNLLWIHCKNVAAMEMCNNINILNFFWHDKDDYTMTSDGTIWAYPGKPPIGSNTIMVMPEAVWPFEKWKEKTQGAYGICSDYVGRLK